MSNGMNKNQDVINEIRWWIGMIPSKTRRDNLKNELQLLIDLQYCGVAASRKDFIEMLERVKREVCK